MSPTAQRDAPPEAVAPNSGRVMEAPSPTDSALARIRELEAENAKLKAGPFADRKALARRDCFFMFRRNPKHPMERIHSSTDERWTELADTTAWARQCEGTFVIKNLLRNGLKWDEKTGAWLDAPIAEPGVTIGDLIGDVTETSFSGTLWSEALEKMKRVEETGMHYVPDPKNVPKEIQRVVAVS